jgi:uncharacterized protein (DUF433 family)
MKTMRAERSPLGDGIRAILSLREAVLLADVSEKMVRKDLETNVLLPVRPVPAKDRPCFRWPDVFLLAAVYRNSHLSRDLRKGLFDRLEMLVAPNHRRENFHRFIDRSYRILELPSQLMTRCERFKVSDYLFIDLDSLFEDVTPRVDLYARGLSWIEEKEGVLGGEATFKGTRLPVRHIGKMFANGESIELILEDYPYLTADDVKFARLYNEAHPSLGRPRTSVEVENDRNAAAR